MAICQTCGNEFKARGSGRKYCSRACYYKAQIGHRPYYTVVPEERVCVGCGNPYLVGGRGNKSRHQHTCSHACAKRHYRTGAVCLELSSVDAAYLAGFIDGEGSIYLYKRRDRVGMRLSVTNTYAEILTWIVEATGVGNVVYVPRASAKHKASYHWFANSEQALSVLEQVRPYLKVKAAQADLAIAFQQNKRANRRRADHAWQHEALEQMQALNRRGPA